MKETLLVGSLLDIWFIKDYLININLNLYQIEI